jgi:hypothetical protein
MMAPELKRELGIEEEYGDEEEQELEAEWAPPPTPKKKGLLSWLFK